MNSPENNNYIQYVNLKGIVKAKRVVFVDDGTTTKFTVDGINETFFVFAVFQNNLPVYGIGFENFDNNDMLGFINSNLVELTAIPEYAFLPPYQSVEMSYNNEYVKNQKFGNSFGSFSAHDVDSNELYDAGGYNVLNVREIGGSALHPDGIFLKQYCEIAFPNYSFVIRPFVHHLRNDKPLLNLGYNCLYYANTNKAGSLNYVFQHLNKGNGSLDDCYGNSNHIPSDNEKILFTQIFPSNGSRFSGITAVTPDDAFALICGYVAVFNDVIAGG